MLRMPPVKNYRHGWKRRQRLAENFALLLLRSDARYPVTIDPTITDEDWESMNPGIPGVDDVVYALAFDAFGHSVCGGLFYDRRGRERKPYCQMGRRSRGLPWDRG